MIAEERLRDLMAACREAVVPSPGFDDLGRRAKRKERQRWVRAIAAAAAAVAVAGATVAVVERGASTTAASTQARHEFIAQANQICDRAIGQVEARRAPLLGPVSPDVLARDFAGQTSADEAAIAALHALPPPPSDRVTVTTMLGHFDAAMGASLVVTAVADAIGDTNSAPYTEALGAASQQIGAASKAALDYGLARCAQLIYPPHF